MDSKLAKKFASFLVKIPDEKLKELAKTQKLLEKWQTAKNINQYVAKCFEARFSGQNDPIEDWKKQGKVKEMKWELVWRKIEVYEALWGLVQLTFSDIKALIEAIGLEFPFCRAFDLFLEIIACKENLVYARHLDAYYKNSVNEQEQLFKLTRKKLWLEKSPLQKELSHQEQEKLNQLTQYYASKQPWLEITWAVCLFKTSLDSSSLIASKVKEFKQKAEEEFDLIVKVYGDSRKGRLPDGKLKSETWIDGECYAGQRYGGIYS